MPLLKFSLHTAKVLNIGICSVFQIIGRLIVGFAVSLSAIGECVYISEIAPVVSRLTYTTNIWGWHGVAWGGVAIVVAFGGRVVKRLGW